MSKYIDADRLIETLNKEKVPFNDDVNYFILNAKAADVVEVRRGRWEYREEYKGSKGGYYYCSLCEMASWASDSPFCPNCGAKMDEVEE